MANNYNQTSFMAPMTQRQAEWGVALHDLLDGDSIAVPDEFSKAWQNLFKCGHDHGGLSVEVDGDGIWCCAEEGFCPDFTVAWLSEIMEQFDLPGPFGFTWSESCSKMRLDEFGGGAVLVTKDGVEWVSAHGWLHEKMEKAKQ